MSNQLRPAGDVSSYSLGGELVVFSEGSQQIYRFNESAALIWQGCQIGLSSDAIAQSLATTYHLAIEPALDDVQKAVARWTSLGLLGDKPLERPPTPPQEEQLSDINKKPSRWRRASTKSEHVYQVLDTTFRARYDTESADALVHPVLAHLEVAAPTNFSTEVTLDIHSNESGHELRRDGWQVGSCSTPNEIAPLVHSSIVLTAYETVDCVMAFHAAALGKGDRCVLLPAPSGGGKSTLAAALMRSGYDYLTDEVVLLMKGTGRIRTLPMSLTLKEDIWPVLASQYPHLDSLPVHLRKDGQSVRYLPPSGGKRTEIHPEHRVEAIVFPRYSNTHETELKTKGPAGALQEIAAAGYDVNNGRLDSERVQEIVDWIGSLDCFELKYRDLSEAVSHIGRLFP